LFRPIGRLGLRGMGAASGRSTAAIGLEQGMAPARKGQRIAADWVLAAGNHADNAPAWHLWLLAGASALIVWRTRVRLLWLLGAGAALGAIGLV